MSSTKVTAEQVNQVIEHLLLLGLTHGMQTSCDEMETAKVALCLRHRSEAVQDLLDDAQGLLVDALASGVVEVLNGLLLTKD